MNRRRPPASTATAGDARRSPTLGPGGDRVPRPPTLPPDEPDDSGLSTPGPELERLVADAMAMAAADRRQRAGAGRSGQPVLAAGPGRGPRGPHAAEMLAATQAHLELARQRLPGELKLRGRIRTDERTAF